MDAHLVAAENLLRAEHPLDHSVKGKRNRTDVITRSAVAALTDSATFEEVDAWSRRALKQYDAFVGDNEDKDAARVEQAAVGTLLYSRILHDALSDYKNKILYAGAGTAFPTYQPDGALHPRYWAEIGSHRQDLGTNRSLLDDTTPPWARTCMDLMVGRAERAIDFLDEHTDFMDLVGKTMQNLGGYPNPSFELRRAWLFDGVAQQTLNPIVSLDQFADRWMERPPFNNNPRSQVAAYQHVVDLHMNAYRMIPAALAISSGVPLPVQQGRSQGFGNVALDFQNDHPGLAIGIALIARDDRRLLHLDPLDPTDTPVVARVSGLWNRTVNKARCPARPAKNDSGRGGLVDLATRATILCTADELLAERIPNFRSLGSQARSPNRTAEDVQFKRITEGLDSEITGERLSAAVERSLVPL